MDKTDTIARNIRNHIIDKANELAELDFQEAENQKLALIAYSLIDAAAVYTAFMLDTVHGTRGFNARKTEFLEELQSYFIESLEKQSDYRLTGQTIANTPKDRTCVVNFQDFIKKE